MILYIDVYLILNFILNLFLIGITALLRGKNASVLRCMLASFFTAVLDVIVYVLSFIWDKKMMLAGFFTVFVLVFGGLHPRSKEEARKDFLVLMTVSFMTGGMLTFLLENSLVNEKIITIVSHHKIVAMCGALLGIFFLFLRLAGAIKNIEQEAVTTQIGKVHHKGKVYAIRILFDTGNQLYSPYTGEPVAVISQSLAEEMELEHTQNPLWIPFHSIGGGGLLPAYRIDSLWVADKKRAVDFLGAVSEQLNAQQGIQMIINTTGYEITGRMEDSNA